jgi:2-amino-4-hydroxy-6-hydroxymethyldihydropteridine diphosphokinase
MPHRAYVGLGSNLGLREVNIGQAIRRMGLLSQTLVRRQSAVMETKPVGGPPGQGDYLNAVVELSTELRPVELLQGLLAIEGAMGRNRGCEVRHGPRVIDLDILLFDQVVCELPGLRLPHPRLAERLFVLVPLAELVPDLQHPVLKCPIRQLLEQAAAAPPPLKPTPL